MDKTFDIEQFRWRLAETIAWCSPRAKLDDPKDSLRASELRPPSFWYAIEKVYSPDSIVGLLAEQRAIWLQNLHKWHRRPTATEPAHDLAGGRLLVYFPYDNLYDGAAEAESGEFFNTDNEPPWDTWVCCRNDGTVLTDQHPLSKSLYVICWVPPIFVEYTGAGIHVNPEVCIEWATELDTPSIRAIKEAGLLA